MAKCLLGLVLCAAACFPMAAMAQDKSSFQGHWLGFSCVGKGAPSALSFSVDSDSTTLHHEIDNEGEFTIEMKDPATYRTINGKTTVYSNHKGLKFVLQVSPDDPKVLVGTVNGTALKLYRGPASDLKKFYRAFAHFCR